MRELERRTVGRGGETASGERGRGRTGRARERRESAGRKRGYGRETGSARERGERSLRGLARAGSLRKARRGEMADRTRRPCAPGDSASSKYRTAAEEPSGRRRSPLTPLSPPLSERRGPEYLSSAPPPPAPQPPIQEAAPLSPPAQGARRASERTFRAFSCRLPGHYAAKQPSPSPPPPPAPPAARAAQLSAGGGVAQPSADGTLAARPQRLLKSKVGGGHQAPRALRSRSLAAKEGRRGGGWGRLGRGGEHHAVCILGHTANAPGARPGRDGEPRCRGGRAQGQAAPEAR